jgi:hypothetical protein
VPSLPIPTDLLALPVGAARTLLVPPVRALRHVTVAAARTVRHWEIVLSMAAAPAERDDVLDGVEHDGADAPRRTTGGRMGWDAEAAPGPEDIDIRDSHDLPVEDWAQLSLADAQARSSSCSPTELATLLAYEQTHGHRVAVELMLQQRLRQEVG